MLEESGPNIRKSEYGGISGGPVFTLAGERHYSERSKSRLSLIQEQQLNIPRSSGGLVHYLDLANMREMIQTTKEPSYQSTLGMVTNQCLPVIHSGGWTWLMAGDPFVPNFDVDDSVSFRIISTALHINTHLLLHEMSASIKIASHSHDERIARIMWAAHILFYLTKTQSHNKQPQDTKNNAGCDDGDTDESSDNGTDYETERTVILSSPRASIREKFLDCIAQLLSPCKGWDGVTATAIREGEDGVEVDVASNDGFLSREGRYCTRLERYLAGCNEGMYATGVLMVA